ncbi:MAG: hypothetical protein MUO85_07530 [candidate division Zixibacteria bacterium]|nr:hypothetical protein [candidate division Zixibacteria bacterium]
MDENYAELSQQQFLNYIKYSLPQKDTLRVSLYNVKGELLYQKNFGLLDLGTYIVKFYNPECPGVYFVSTQIENQPAYKKAIQITSEAFPPKEVKINPDTATSIIDGLWKRSYSEKFIPAVQPAAKFPKIEYHYKYDLQVQFINGQYKIVAEVINEDNGGKEIKIFEGRFITKGDTLKLYEDSKLNKVFQYKIEEDTLSISCFVSKDEKTGAIVLPMEKIIYNTEIELLGEYHK